MPTQPPTSFPTDSYAQAPEPQVLQASAPSPAGPPPTPPSQPDPLEEPATPAEHHTSYTERFLHGLCLLVVVLTVLIILVWLDLDMYSKVVSSRPIGHFLRMSGPGGLLRDVVIETETGFYPLWGAPVITQGTPLVLEVRETGFRYICDEPRSLCVETTAKEFKTATKPPSPPTSSQASQGAKP